MINSSLFVLSGRKDTIFWQDKQDFSPSDKVEYLSLGNNIKK
jgi:hypothetical protein